MTDHYHAVVWIDHHQARVLHFNLSDSDTEVIHPHNPKKNIHSHAFQEEAIMAQKIRTICMRLLRP
jgi:hypothetical protein